MKCFCFLAVGASAQDIFLSKSPNLFSQDCSTRSTPSDDPLEHLCYLLKKNRDTYDISWAPPYVPPATFQDHIPYDLVAQYLLGASAQQLTQTYEFHEQDEGLVPAIPSTGAITKDNWQAHIGETAENPSVLYSDYVEFYRSEVQSAGAKQTMQTYLPFLVDGVFGKLFHGMQTLGWGYGFTGDEDMVAQGLAWMSTAYAPPSPLNPQPTKTDMKQVFEEMHQDARFPTYTGDPTIFYGTYRDDLIANYSDVMSEYDLLVPDEIELADAENLAQHMSDEVMKLFAAYNFSHFTNVHYSGSVQSMQKMLEWVDGKTRSQLLRRMWQAINYNFGIQSRPSPEMPPIESAPPAWENLLARSFNQTDVHVHELMFYTMKQHHDIDDERLRQCADMALKLFENGGDWDF
jgi:hypothetical protein